MKPDDISLGDYMADPTKYGAAPQPPSKSDVARRLMNLPLRSARKTVNRADDTETTPSLYEGSKVANSNVSPSTSIVPTSLDADESIKRPPPDATTVASLDSISTEINAALNSPGEHEVVFQVEWTLHAYLRAYGVHIASTQIPNGFVLPQSFVLTGTPKSAWATTAENFLRSQWKSFVQKCNVLRLLSEALSAKAPYGQLPIFYCSAVAFSLSRYFSISEHLCVSLILRLIILRVCYGRFYLPPPDQYR